MDAEWFHNLEVKLPNDGINDRVLRLFPEHARINFLQARPFVSFTGLELTQFAELALNRDWKALELATLIQIEASYRKNKIQNSISKIFNKHQVKPIHWLAKARKSIHRIHKRHTINGPALGSVYFVLLNINDKYCCYVGQTQTVKLEEFPDRQTARIAQHFNGIRHSRHVKRHGLEPLWSLNCFTQRVPAGKVMSAESAFHDELHLNGITLRGDGGTRP